VSASDHSLSVHPCARRCHCRCRCAPSTAQLKKFYSDVVGVPVWWIALTVSLAVSLDALTDPLIGFVSDSLRWEYKGEPMRRRPFIAIGSGVEKRTQHNAPLLSPHL
jgi:hypothetical protein